MSREIHEDGSFQRQQNYFRKRFGLREGMLPVEKDRYRLIWAAPCPWSHRAVIVRKILGLEDVISLGEVDPIRPKLSRIDWAFTQDDGAVDPVLQVKYLSEVYKKADPTYHGRPTVPAVVDVKKGAVVNNDYHTLTIDFATVWAPFHKEKAPDLYPKSFQKKIDEINEVIFHDVNNGVYKCGFAKTQTAYDRAYDQLFQSLEELDELLGKQRFLLGDFITDSDVRLYVTLARFDVAYYTVFKTNKYRLIDFPNLWAYARDLYQTPGFGETTNFEAIKAHYYMSAQLSAGNLKSEMILPKGPDLSGWTEDPKREHLNNGKEKFFYGA